MPKVAATFDDQQHADAVVSELGRLNIDELDWRVHQPGDGATGTVPVVGIPTNTGGTGSSTAGGGSAVVAPLLAGEGDLDAGDGDEDDYLRQARNRGAIVIVVDAPSGAEATVQDIFSRHSAANMTVS